MTRVDFDRQLYAGTAVDEAVKVFAPHAAFTLTEEPRAWVVKVEASEPGLEREIVRELQNYALGLTIKGRGA